MIASLILCLLFSYPASATDGEVGSTQLINRAKSYDRQEIVYAGEVIGDILKAGDHVWLNVSDGSNALGVWVQSDQARAVEVPGRYNQHGDTIRVSGMFHRACPEHGGDMDLHAGSITLLSRGYPINHEVQGWKVWLAVCLSTGAAACMAGLLARLARRSTARSRV